jgi:hypothetical protein
MNSQVKKNQPKLWIIIVVILVILGCCFVSLVLAGGLFLRSENITLEDFFSGLIGKETQSDITEALPEECDQILEPEQEEPSFDQKTAIPPEEEEIVPQEEPVEEETSHPLQMEDFLLAITTSGIWKVNEESQEVQQISTDVLDGPQPYIKGFSPDKKYYAYITGDINPTLVVLNLQTNSSVWQMPLSSPNSQIKPDMDASDPGQSVLLAMQTFGSMAWSPDSKHLAFVAAMDNSNTDLYLLNIADLSISRLSDENSNAARVNWSLDGRFIEYVTVNNFGTGAGMDMDAIWVYDRSQGNAKLLEQSTSSGEEFVSWIDNETFYIHSWSAICSSHNLRSINAVTGSQDVILESCFSSVAYDPVGKLGIVAVGDLFVNACQCGDVDDYGTYSFGESLGMNDAGIKIKKFEYINAYGVELLDPGNLFAIYTEQGLSHLFDETGFPIAIPSAVSGLKPFPSPTGDYWVWYPYYGDSIGLWVTDDQSTVFELSATASGNVVWSNGGERVYFFETNRIFYADAPGFIPTLFVDIPVNQVYAIGK